MSRLAVCVEGRTEEEFVNRAIAGRLREKDVRPCPILLNGNVTVERLAENMAGLFWNFDAVTSLVDFYGFRRRPEKTPEDLERRIHDEVAGKIKRSWDETKVIPYVQQYEFEGLLFSDVDAFARLPDILSESLRTLKSIRARFRTPEDINDDRKTAPSKRIAGAVPRYNKVADGPQLVEDMGLPAIRAACPRFREWMTRLESLGQSERGAS